MDQLDFRDTTVHTSTDETMVEGDPAIGDRDAFAKFVLVVYGAICSVGITGNLLVAVVLLRVPSLRSNTSDFLVHLSVVDFMVCVLVIPSYLVPPRSNSTPNTGFFGEFWCRFYTTKYIFWVFTVTSVFCLTTVSLERYVAIVHPHKYKMVFTRKNKYIMIASCWIMAAITKSDMLVLYKEDEVKGCHFSGWPTTGAKAAYGLYNFILRFFFPLAVMLYAQLKVISTLNKQVKELTSRAASTGANPRDHRREMWQLRASQTLVKTLLACVITFAVCWAPNQIWFLLFNFGVAMVLGSADHRVTIILAVANSCVNPIIYTMMNKPFRQGILQIFCKRQGSNQVGSVNTVSETVSSPSRQLGD
ncbi:somatostatin receptor type 5-like [Asterias rubens]|uniref:somatostatin receptor type 5-like n=1 Tax=Asterias rubens TaxID=7604 RepID=UPI001454FC7C|nr:somatostatin receptor type 5-like [Asterias rubens]